MNNEQVRVRVGVVGAGFAGLAVCRALTLMNRSASIGVLFEVAVFDEKPLPTDKDVASRGSVLIGEEGRRLLEQLRVNFCRRVFPREWQRVELLQMLSQGIEKNIHYSERVTSIAADNTSGSTVVYTGRDKRYHFDLIIAADGLASPTRNIACSDPMISRKFLLIGDARCQYRTEYLCGCSRIRYGITSAMYDAIMVVNVLNASICKSPRKQSLVGAVQITTCSQSKYSISSWKSERGKRFVVALCSIASIAAILINSA